MSDDAPDIAAIPPEVRGYFLTYPNFKIILTQTVIVALGALGMTLIIISGGIDLSVGSAIAFTSVVGALLIQRGWPAAAVPTTPRTSSATGRRCRAGLRTTRMRSRRFCRLPADKGSEARTVVDL